MASDFEIEFIKGDSNFVPDFLTQEILQNMYNASEEMIDKGKGISLEPISEKPEPTNTHPKTEPWISITKKEC